MALEFRPASKKRINLRIAIVGPSGSGKTTAALNIALGLGGRVAVIDLEGGASELLAPMGPFDTLTLQPPFTVGSILEALEAANSGGYTTVVIDSLSPVWLQLLNQKALLDSRPNSNAFSNWRPISQEYDALVQAILRAPLHVVATLRSKPSHVQVFESGRQVVKRVGDEPIMRDGFEYENTITLALDRDTHEATAIKDRTDLFEGKRTIIDLEAGKALARWLADTPPETEPGPKMCPEGQWLRSLITAEQMEEFKGSCAVAGKEWKAVARSAMKAGAKEFGTIMAEVGNS